MEHVLLITSKCLPGFRGSRESRREMTEMLIHPRDLEPIRRQFFICVYSEDAFCHQCVL